MKRIFIVILSLIFLSGCTFNMYPDEIITKDNEIRSVKETEKSEYVKSVWIAYYELSNLLKNSDEKSFKKTADRKMKVLKDMGFNTVTVQVRAFADSIYPSKYFLPSAYCFPGKQSVPFDAFQIICTAADKYGINVEAWVNPYRVQFENDISKLPENSIALKWLKNKSKKSNVYTFKKGIYFNPASKDVTKLIVSGVKEIVENYPVTAIHFDDYFYPSTDKNIDSVEYRKYRRKGGKLSLYDFRRENVSNMVKSVYKAVKSINKKVLFGISPAANIDYNKNELYADVEKWVSQKGFVDYICPQVYFGFRNIYQPFMFTVKKWLYISKCDLYIGLPLYKCGKADKYAAKDDKSIINEFKDNNNIISRQVNYLLKIPDIKGIYVFSYSSLFDETKKAEVDNMINALQDSNHPQLNNR